MGNLPVTTIQVGAAPSPGNPIGLEAVNGDYALTGRGLKLEFQGLQNAGLGLREVVLVLLELQINPLCRSVSLA